VPHPGVATDTIKEIDTQASVIATAPRVGAAVQTAGVPFRSDLGRAPKSGLGGRLGLSDDAPSRRGPESRPCLQGMLEHEGYTARTSRGRGEVMGNLADSDGQGYEYMRWAGRHIWLGGLK